MTCCVAEAWEIFCCEKTDIVIRSFCCLGIAPPISESYDEELSIKGLETTSLVVALKDWKTLGMPVDSPSDSKDDSDSESIGPDKDLRKGFTISSPTPTLQGQKSGRQYLIRGVVHGTWQKHQGKKSASGRTRRPGRSGRTLAGDILHPTRNAQAM